MSNAKQILMVAGEPSGDLHAAGVVRALRSLAPGVQVWGIGGERMAAAGQEQLYTTKQMAMIGFTEVVKHLPFLRRVFRHLEEEVQRRRPGCAVLVDYPGFNLRLAERLHRLGVPVLYYIAPQVWAWGARRIPKMARTIDRLAVVFPFEKPLFEQAGITTEFVGHPLLEGLQPELEPEDFRRRFQIAADAPVLGLLPGSRTQEVRRLLPDMLKTAAILRRKIASLRVLVSCSPDLEPGFYESFLAANPEAGAQLAVGCTYSLMQNADICLVSSGTATLETACFATPMVIVYRVSRMSYHIGKRLVRLEHIGLANIVAGEPVVPELVQDAFRPQAAAERLEILLRDEAARAAMIEKLRQVRKKLGAPGASQRVANMALEMIWQQAAGKIDSSSSSQPG